MTNPLQLSRSQFYHYIHMTYLRCLSCCFYCPDVWLQFAEFEFSFDRENAKKVLEKAIAAIPESVLLRFGCCDFFEQHEMFEECENYYKQCIEEFKEPIIWIKYLQYTQRQRGVDACHALFLEAIQQCTDASVFIAMGTFFTVIFFYIFLKPHSHFLSITFNHIQSHSHFLSITFTSSQHRASRQSK